MRKKPKKQGSGKKSKPGPKEKRLVIEGDPAEALRRFLHPDKNREREKKD